MIGMAPTSGMRPDVASESASPMTAALERTSGEERRDQERAALVVSAPRRSPKSWFVAKRRGAVVDELHAEEQKAEPEDRLTDVAHVRARTRT